MNAGQRIQHALDIVRKHLHALRCRDRFFLATPDREPSRLVHLADVTGVKPAVLERFCCFRFGVVIAWRDVRAAHQNFAVRRDLHLDPAIGSPTVPAAGLNGYTSVTIGAVSVRPYSWTTA